ncbi:hypothetical protein ERN12_00930 [Rhodobacteraceae bacterium]|nr:hypothetical protein ERN12_00930 [Paracoccaceae bacterium]
MIDELKHNASKTTWLWGAALGITVFLFVLHLGFWVAVFYGLIAAALFGGFLRWAFIDGTLDMHIAELEVGGLARAVPPSHSAQHDDVVAYQHSHPSAQEFSQTLDTALQDAGDKAQVHMDKVNLRAMEAETRVHSRIDKFPGRTGDQTGHDERPEADADDTQGLRKPSGLDAPRGGKADDLQQIEGIGPKLEERLNSWGVWHFDQIAAWGPQEIAFADASVPSFKGRCTRDDWVSQARTIMMEGADRPVHLEETKDT